MSFFWEPWQIKILHENWGKGGKSAREIGELVGLSRNAVIGRAHRDGLKSLKKAPKSESRRKKSRPLPRQTGARSLVHGPQGCQWIDGEPRHRQFCGAPRVEGSSYCEAHHIRCWVKPADYRSEAA